SRDVSRGTSRATRRAHVNKPYESVSIPAAVRSGHVTAPLIVGPRSPRHPAFTDSSSPSSHGIFLLHSLNCWGYKGFESFNIILYH
ncbi:hypothetical protein J6590_017657, partial [Homalodisca vitripennis]